MLVAAALLASTMAAVTGTGGGILLLPVMVWMFGVRDAVPMYAVAQLIGNVSRVWLNLKEIRFRIFGWFSLGAVPLAVLGAVMFSVAPPEVLTRLLGGFLIAIVIARRAGKFDLKGRSPRWFVLIGGVFAFISALLGSAGPFLAPFFASFGLMRGAYIGTEACATAVMHITKLSTYQAAGVLSATALLVGVVLGPVMVIGSWLGKRVLDRLSDRVFMLMIDVIVLGFGTLFLVRG